MGGMGRAGGVYPSAEEWEGVRGGGGRRSLVGRDGEERVMGGDSLAPSLCVPFSLPHPPSLALFPLSLPLSIYIYLSLCLSFFLSFFLMVAGGRVDETGSSFITERAAVERTKGVRGALVLRQVRK